MPDVRAGRGGHECLPRTDYGAQYWYAHAGDTWVTRAGRASRSPRCPLSGDTEAEPAL